ncbi:hypothetical protein TVAG_401880 [Trichomonas vaginalis G3]|uniref:Uncharacterized protein n=1 Tax=Trichomonas vaginalis (strain ATCC PRA-98 / G3) TaxID=412133 RepID=A2DHU6_TRIV3|nr:armadillo (ARM) repeat-containing protein family [Trichomonas vaginalis G3]EAY19935.1 hypothetical protein TVAG_401880 [Trichomonas vaginalis G3]KAI5525885.1 armadillo (ARM) repeat-containing protein family [Trichomonas vaginalis G3]|eukprot:XP_001580921.1 hypothetical protein [Trichomonas vaginalis G3]
MFEDNSDPEDYGSKSFGKTQPYETTFAQRYKINASGITNDINNCDLKKFQPGINKLTKYFEEKGPPLIGYTGALLFERLQLCFDSNDPLVEEYHANEELRKAAFHLLCWFGYDKCTTYPADQLSNPEYVEQAFNNIKSTNIELVNDGLGLLTGVIHNIAVYNYFIENNGLDIIFQLDNRTFIPIFLRKLFKLWSNDKNNSENDFRSSVYHRTVPFIYQFLDSRYSVVKNRTFNVLRVLKKRGIEVDPNEIINRLPNLLQDPYNAVIAAALTYIRKVPEVSQELFKQLIEVSNKNQKIGIEVFKYLYKRVDTLSQENISLLVEALLEAATNGPAKLGEYALPILTELTTANNIWDERLIDAYMKFLQEPRTIKVSIEGLCKCLEISEGSGHNQDVIDRLSEYTDIFSELMQNDDEVVSHFSSQILERLEQL